MTSQFRTLRLPTLFLLLIFITAACNQTPRKSWTEALPATATLVYIYDEGTSLSQALSSDAFSFLNLVSETDFERITEVENASRADLLLRAMFIEPTGANTWSPVWIGSYSGYSAAELASRFSRSFTQNTYSYNGQTIHRLFLQDGTIYYAAQLNDLVLISPNSAAMESSVGSYLGMTASLELPQGSETGASTILNYPELGNFVKQLGNPRFRPLIDGAFKGLSPATLSSSSSASDEKKVTTFESNVTLNNEDASELVKILSHSPSELRMDRYVPSDAAVFGMFKTGDFSVPETFEAQAGLDSLFTNSPSRLRDISVNLGEQAAFAGFHTFGFSPLEETVYIRQINNRTGLRSELEKLIEEGHGQQARNFFTFRSKLLAQALGTTLSPYQDFVLGFAGDIVILAPRSGLIQRVINDMNRRRVLYYDDEYMGFRNTHADNLSAFFYADNQAFRPFIEPFTDPVSNAMAYAPYFDVMTLSASSNSSSLQLRTELHQLERASQPFADRWYYPLSGAELTGPVSVGSLFQISGNNVVFATTNNRVTALASDGTEIFTASTGEDRPIGSPVIYDWYANNQKAVLVAAGNKIYGWNNRGQSLPNFPFVLNETITTPLLVADISRSGLPEAVVATADRNIHVLGGRGTSLNGWPQTANSVVRHKLVFEPFDGSNSIWAFAENAVLGWDPDGTPRSGFPVFADAPLMGQPVINNNRIFGGGADGNLYAISREGTFDNGITIPLEQNENGETSGNYRIQAVNASDSPLIVKLTSTLRVPVTDRNEITGSSGETRLEQMNVIAAHSLNGSLFLYGTDGHLRFTRSLGQPALEEASLVLADLNRDNRPEILSVAQFGRMYAWTIETNSSYDGLPSTAVHYPTASRLGSDGLINIIAGTRDGVRSWAVSN